MYAARRFQYSLDVLSIGQSPVISFFALSELSHSVSNFGILSETGNPAHVFEIPGEVGCSELSSSDDMSHSADNFDILSEAGALPGNSRL